MRNSEILTYIAYIACGLSVLLGVITFTLLMAAEAYSHHCRQPRQRARGPHPTTDEQAEEATDGNFLFGPGLPPEPIGVRPAGPLTHNFRYVETSIPVGLTLDQWRHGAGR